VDEEVCVGASSISENHFELNDQSSFVNLVRKR